MPIVNVYMYFVTVFDSLVGIVFFFFQIWIFLFSLCLHFFDRFSIRVVKSAKERRKNYAKRLEILMLAIYFIFELNNPINWSCRCLVTS